MNWVRIACDIEDDPQVRAMARALGLELSTAVGMMVRVFARLPKHARDGNVAHLDAFTFEDWTDWRGEPGAFAREFLARFVVDGVVRSWEKHNGAAIREADRRAAIQRRRREEAKRKREAERNGDTPPKAPKKSRRRAKNDVPAPVPVYASGDVPVHDTQGVFTNGTGRDVPDPNRSGNVPAPTVRSIEELDAARQRREQAMASFREEARRPTPSRPLARLVAIA